MRNVVLVCLDSVRKDIFDRYASTLRRRAGVEYAGCRAASSWSAPSYASMLTGDLPSEHGVHAHDRTYDGIDPADTFLDELPSHRSAGVSTNAFAGSAFGFDRFFDSFVDVTETTRFPEGLDPASFTTDGGGIDAYRAFLRAALDHDRPGKSLANGVAGFLDSVSEDAPVPKLFDDGATAVIRAAKNEAHVEEPFFLFTVFMEAHTPLRPMLGFDRRLHDAPNDFTTDDRGVWDLMGRPERHPEFLETRRELYAAAIDYLDRQLGSFVDWLDDNTTLPTTVVVTADHGENQGYPEEDGLVRHKSSLSEGVLHVPLLIIDPPGTTAGIEPGLVSQLDLGTLLVGVATDELPDVTAKRIPAEIVGMSAGPEPPSRREHWDRAIRAVYDGNTKVVWDSLGDVSRYTLNPDRSCWQRQIEALGEIPAWANEPFETPIEKVKERALVGDEAEVEDRVQARLEKLGYA